MGQQYVRLAAVRLFCVAYDLYDVSDQVTSNPKQVDRYAKYAPAARAASEVREQ